LINDSQTISDIQFQEYMNENLLNIELTGAHLLCIIKIDKTLEAVGLQEKKLFYFAISNIAQEIVSAKYRCETVEMKQDHLVMLINIYDPVENVYTDLIQELQQAQEVVLRLYHVAFSAAISENVENIEKLSLSYNETLQNLQYKFIFGPGAVIVPGMVRLNH